MQHLIESYTYELDLQLHPISVALMFLKHKLKSHLLLRGTLQPRRPTSQSSPLL
jgi:hypothetical protein